MSTRKRGYEGSGNEAYRETDGYAIVAYGWRFQFPQQLKRGGDIPAPHRPCGGLAGLADRGAELSLSVREDVLPTCRLRLRIVIGNTG